MGAGSAPGPGDQEGAVGKPCPFHCECELASCPESGVAAPPLAPWVGGGLSALQFSSVTSKTAWGSSSEVCSFSGEKMPLVIS